MTKSIALAILTLCLLSLTAQASDLTIFGGAQHHGQLTFQTAPGFAQSFDPKTFGVFGVRIRHGKLFGAEHTLAYAPHLIESTSNSAFIYHSNLSIQAPLPVVKPYGTVGIGLVHGGGGGSSPASAFGTKFAINYGAGVKAMAGPVGVDFDVRGYRIPKITANGYTAQNRLDFVQVSGGVVFKF